MHEMALAEGILAIALDAAGKQKVEKIRIRVGNLQHVTLESLEFSFRLMAEGTDAAEAKIDIETIPARYRCNDCESEGQIRLPVFQCLSCGSAKLEVLSGEEIFVESVELINGVVIRNSKTSLGEALEEHLKDHHGNHRD